MSRFVFLRSRRGMAALAAVVVLAAVALVWGLGGDDTEPQAAPNTATSSPEPEPSETEPTEAEPTKPEPTEAPTCEGPTTRFNVEGVEQDSLLPDCGQQPVSAPEQNKSGLGLGCGGSYPIILYKTRTPDSKSSICGVTSSGEKLRVVVAADGGEARDLKGRYEYTLDAFVAKDGDTTYIVQAYDGTIVTKSDGQTDTEKSVEWSSLDNESDGEAE